MHGFARNSKPVNGVLKLPRVDRERDFSADFRESTVDSMFGEGPLLLIGALFCCLVVMAAAVLYKSPIIATIAVALPIVAAARVSMIVLYWRRKRHPADPRTLLKWEIAYGAGAAVHVSLLSLFCAWTFLYTPDGFGRIASLSGVLAYLVGVPCRNFASGLLVTALSFCAAAPIYAALLYTGGANILIAVLVLTPFFATIHSVARRLRGVFQEAAVRAHELSRLAGRFDSALNNMPCGLVMMDSRGRVVVTNHKLSELLQLPAEEALDDADLKTLFERCARNGLIDRARAFEALAAVRARIADGAGLDPQLDLNDGRILSLTVQNIEDGGAVLLFNDVTERNLAAARINELARFDTLTGLPNRIEFSERAAALLPEKAADEDIALMFVDLDEFKQVNDTLGHAVGDQLLRAAAERLKLAVRPGDLVARLGGDEFVVFLDSASSLAQIEAIARAIVAAMAKPFDITGQQLRVGASIGIARGVDVGLDLGVLLRCADMALYLAKADGRGSWRLFEPDMEIRARARRELEFDLRAAIENDELDLCYQPIYHVAEQRFSGCEALVRWRHELRGMVPPSVFVPIAEEMGFVVEMDDCVLRKACQAAASWGGDNNIAVNLSAMSFETVEIIERVKNALALSRLSPERLEIEITETALLRNVEMTRSILHELRKLGVRISLDDFGTGYSSLSYLHSLPLNKIKIDRSFLAGLDQDPRALKLLTGVAQLSKDLGLTIVVEGVETQEQFALITSATEVDEIQGFLFSVAVPQAEIARMFGEQQKSAA
jgi:diguanylate cyclase (GGDEF)-like protein